MRTNIGIRGIGWYLPPEVRPNAWWPPEVVERWRAAMLARAAAAPPPPAALTAGERLVLEALARQEIDPFQGTVSRHVMPDDMSVLDMEEHAARMAIERAGIAPGDIDLLLTNMVVPDYALGNPACSLHHRLGLPRACLSMHSDVPSYTFMMQLTLAEAMIHTGRARSALLVQSCAPSRLVEPADPLAPYFGDAATAVVVGRVGEGRGIEAAVHFTDGRLSRTLVASVPGGRWYDAGRPVLHIVEPQQMQRALLETADMCKVSLDAALAQASRAPSDVGFFCIQQGTPWLRPVVQAYLELPDARWIETFQKTAYVFASAQPLALALAAEGGKLVDDDLALLIGGGPGATYGAALIRWGA
ncbi:MAG TPA: 3-oxoacyl-[acyl-carrier-protein] synthase III C-terminal domain-containing protein [Kofleriaceae bacterium]|nr:3-oxoacyl-[acyl-carrier-protein] synthase III C-terminal domain-containing protein [Kofleriaceae bacterium]